MEKEFKQTLNFLQIISDKIHYFVAENIYDLWVLQAIAKLVFLVLMIYVIDFLLKLLINNVFKLFSDEKKYPVLKAVHESRITHSAAHLFALLFGNMALYSIFWRHPESYEYLERFIDLLIVVVVANMAYRLLKAIKFYNIYKQDYYRIVAINAISQTLKTIGIFIFTMIAVSVVFGIKSTTILGSLGAITAVLVLVFRDTILGFMTGIHVATSKSLKVGDWIGIPKYDLEGTIMEINIITTKIQNFDKTISTIPTYDLLSTEIRNLQVMAEGNKRRIKRSIVFNIKSFKFLDSTLLERLKRINLIKDYLTEKTDEINLSNADMENNDLLINGRQLTNIGVFRKYVENYLRHDPDVDTEELLMVRQLENTTQGMPLEIYCFANKAKMTDYEQIQADIFDHLLVAAEMFELEIMQINRI